MRRMKDFERLGFSYGVGAAGEEWSKDVGDHHILITEADEKPPTGWLLGVYSPEGDQIIVLYFRTPKQLASAIAVI